MFARNVARLGWSGLAMALILGVAIARASDQPVSAESPHNTVRFAVFGDYGLANPNEAAVAALVQSWNIDFIITTGDNNYPNGAAATIDPNIGQYYHDFIYPYVGGYGGGSPDINRFFPSLGNHDWNSITCSGSACSGPYFDYFTLDNNERYYDFVWGPAHFFALDSDSREPDGNTSSSTQAAWLQTRLTDSTSACNVVFFHHAPYSSSSNHGSNPALQWPFTDWGANIILAGHDHVYERLHVNGIPYFVSGLGGNGRYGFSLMPEAGSQFRYNDNFGAMLVDISDNIMSIQFINIDNVVVDSHTYDCTQLLPVDPPPCAVTMLAQALPEHTKGMSMLRLLYRLRDEQLAGTSFGRRFIADYYAHSPELLRLMAVDGDLRRDMVGLLDSAESMLRSLLDANGATPLPAEWLHQLQAVVTRINEKASPALRADIEATWRTLNLPAQIGRPVRAIWADVNRSLDMPVTRLQPR